MPRTCKTSLRTSSLPSSRVWFILLLKNKERTHQQKLLLLLSLRGKIVFTKRVTSAGFQLSATGHGSSTNVYFCLLIKLILFLCDICRTQNEFLQQRWRRLRSIRPSSDNSPQPTNLLVSICPLPVETAALHNPASQASFKGRTDDEAGQSDPSDCSDAAMDPHN